MKKLFLVIFCTIVLGVFIGFNYLLWDREEKIASIKGLQSINAASDSSIAALTRQLKSLEDDKDSADERIKQLEDLIKQYDNDKNTLRAKVFELQEMQSDKDDTIFKLKQMIDVKDFDTQVRKWIEAIDTNNYKAAYDIYGKDLGDPSKSLTIDEFTSLFKNVVRSIKIKSVKQYLNEYSEDRGKIILEVNLEVRNYENIPYNKQIFNEGENKRFFTVDYDKINETWGIVNYSKLP